MTSLPKQVISSEALAIQQKLEDDYRFLALLFSLNYFDGKEIAMMKKKRTDFEYSIRGSNSTIFDFLEYIDWEINLEKLRRMRVITKSKLEG